MAKERITFDMTGQQIVLAMAGGNPGAIRVTVELMKFNEQIDPMDAMGPFGPILMMDTLGIYEERIWMLYKDVCGEDYMKLIAMLRAFQLGVGGVTEEVLNHAIDNYGQGIDVDAVVAAVKERLPEFNTDFQYVFTG